MPAGRPKKPTQLKKLEGTAREDRLLKNEMMPSKICHVPSAPTWMSKDAKKEWKATCADMIELDMLYRVDLGLLAAYCVEMSNYINAVKELQKPGEGFVIDIVRSDGSKYPMLNYWNTVKNQSLKNALSIATQFGFTPSARTRISATPKDEEDAFEKLLNIGDE